MLILWLIIILIILLYIYLKYHYSYWPRHGFPFDAEATIPFGSLKSVTTHKKSMGMAMYDVYNANETPFVGVYLLHRPGVLIRDAELARSVLAANFTCFHDRGVYVDEKNNPMSATLFAMRGKSWKNMREKLSISFTSGKLKGMFENCHKIAENMVNFLNTVIPESGSAEVDLKDICVT